MFPTFVLVTNAPNKDKATRQADPIANPFPIAAVVFPAESNWSVVSLILSSSSHILAKPPALSEIGPYPSIAKAIGRLDNIPKADSAIPYIPAIEKLPKTDNAIKMVGIIFDMYPTANPRIKLMAAPDLQDSTSFFTGENDIEVKYSVDNPINNPLINPIIGQTIVTAFDISFLYKIVFTSPTE